MKRTLFEADHLAFRNAVRTFIEREVSPYHARWEQEGIVPRELWRKAGSNGFLGFFMPQKYGGMGVDDFRFNVALDEELARVGASGPGFPLHNDIVGPYMASLTDAEQKERWLPGFVSGELISAIAMTEPGAGSDLRGVRTTAKRTDRGFILNGQKTFISNGILADLVIVFARADLANNTQGFSLLVVEEGTPGFSRGRNLKKIGQSAQDTAELFFEDVEVPFNNLLGTEGDGLRYLMERLPRERICASVTAIAMAEQILEKTIAYCNERTAFGRPLLEMQNTQFQLAELSTEVDIGRVFVDRMIEQLASSDLLDIDTAKAKWWTTEIENKVIDRCLQLHGGYGYMSEFPVARAWLDARVHTIYGGSTEIMKQIIGRSLTLDGPAVHTVR